MFITLKIIFYHASPDREVKTTTRLTNVPLHFKG